MKITLETLSAHLAKGLGPAYLISGDEPLLVAEAADAVRASARAQGFAEREVYQIERGNAVWEQIRQSAQAMSLFSARRIIEIRMAGGKPPAAGVAVIEGLLKAPAGDIVLLIITGKLDRDASAAGWVQLVQERGAWLPVWPVDLAHLPQWLRARFTQAGLAIDDDALQLLVERSEGNLLAARQEVEKLALLTPPGGRVTLADAAASSIDHARFDVFQLGAAVRQGDASRALRVLSGLRAEDAEPVLVLWSLVRELRVRQGVGYGGRSNYGAPPPRAAAGGPSIPWLVARAARADRCAKGMRTGDPWDEIKLLTLELTGRRTLPLVDGNRRRS